jgi:hypothetical protein
VSILKLGAIYSICSCNPCKESENSLSTAVRLFSARELERAREKEPRLLEYSFCPRTFAKKLCTLPKYAYTERHTRISRAIQCQARIILRRSRSHRTNEATARAASREAGGWRDMCESASVCVLLHINAPLFTLRTTE